MAPRSRCPRLIKSPARRRVTLSAVLGGICHFCTPERFVAALAKPLSFDRINQHRVRGWGSTSSVDADSATVGRVGARARDPGDYEPSELPSCSTPRDGGFEPGRPYRSSCQTYVSCDPARCSVIEPSGRLEWSRPGSGHLETAARPHFAHPSSSSRATQCSEPRPNTGAGKRRAALGRALMPMRGHRASARLQNDRYEGLVW